MQAALAPKQQKLHGASAPICIFSRKCQVIMLFLFKKEKFGRVNKKAMQDDALHGFIILYTVIPFADNTFL